jgi:hypothetical protein
VARKNSTQTPLVRLVVAAALGGHAPVIVAEGSAGEAWKAVADVPSVVVHMHWVSTAELVAAARAYGKRPSARPMGFSVLQKDRSGQYVCDVYLIDRPHRVGDRATGSLGHEIAHCIGYSHE